VYVLDVRKLILKKRLGESKVIISQEDVAILNELGLSVTQAKVYYATARAKPLGAQDIATVSGVARPHAYEALNDLVKIGLVIKIIDKPERFIAIPLVECASMLMQTRIKKTSELEERVRDMLNRSVLIDSPVVLAQGIEFAIMPGNEPGFKRVADMVRRTEKSICLMGTIRKMFYWVTSYNEVLTSAMARNVDLRIVSQNFNEKGKLKEFFSNNTNFSFRAIPEPPKATFILFDQKEVYLSVSVTDEVGLSNGFWSKNKALVYLIHDYFEYIWASADTANLQRYRALDSKQQYNQ
jgi:sugar-specific transcriptional regulator TrmB